VGSPILGASRRVEGENIEFGCTDQSIIRHDQTGLEPSELIDVVCAENLQMADILRVDLAEWGETLRSECSVITGPVSCCSGTQYRRGKRRGCNNRRFVIGIQLRRCPARGADQVRR
jgi:hypothetical protein